MKTLLCKQNVHQFNSLRNLNVCVDSVQICDYSFSTPTTLKPFGYEARENITRGIPS